LIDGELGLAVPIQPPGDLEGLRTGVCLVFEDQRHLGHGGRRPLGTTGIEDVLHPLTP
jgi:hypothetical protein